MGIQGSTYIPSGYSPKLDSEVRKNSNLLHDLKVRDSLTKFLEGKVLFKKYLRKN